jgi:uncharacterized delta-60 repeat protein
MRYLVIGLIVFLLAACDQNKIPTAAFSLTPESGTAPLEVTVDSAASADADGTIANVTWDWGDGSATDTGATATHTYTTEGTFTVKLSVTDNENATVTTEKTVTVATPAENPIPDDPTPNDPDPNSPDPDPAPSGVLDESFGEAGKVVVKTDEADFIVDMVTQKDGKILTLGTQGKLVTESFFVIRRFNPDGSLDNSFGTRGTVVMDENFAGGGGTFFQPNLSAAIAVQDGGSNDGRICFVGTGFNQPDIQGEGVDQPRAIIGCLTPEGDPDNSFDDNAFAFPFSNKFQVEDEEGEIFVPEISASDIHIDGATGDITIGATLTDSEGDDHFWFFRLPPGGFENGDGGFDEFDVSFGFFGGRLSAFTVLDNGDIIAVGSDSDDPDSTDSTLARISKNGLLLAKKTFNLSTGGDKLVDVTLDSEGNVLAAGDVFFADGPGFLFKGLIARFDDNTLELDTSFGVAGKVITENSTDTNVGFTSLELDAQDRIITVGEQAGDFIAARFLTDGKPDASFGDNGQTLVDFGAGDKANALVLDDDGKIVVAGFAKNESNTNNFALARLNP